MNLQKIWENKLECKIYVTVTLFQALRVKDQLSTENISILQIFSCFNFCLARTENVVYQKIDTADGSFSSRLNNIFLNIWLFLEISFFLQVQYAFLQEAIVHAITHYGHLTEPFHKVDEMWWVSDERFRWNRQTLLALHWNYFNNKVPNRLFQILKLHPGNTLRILPNSELNNGVSEKKKDNFREIVKIWPYTCTKYSLDFKSLILI